MNGKTNDDALNEVSGGVNFFLFDACEISGSTPGQPYEVLDVNGNKIASFATEDQAIKYLGTNRYMDLEKNWNQVLQLRGLL